MILGADFYRCEQLLHSNDNDFWRRTYIKTGFSMFEAMNEMMRQVAMAVACVRTESYNMARLIFLGNISNRILKNGTIEMEELRAPFINYTAFILRSLAKECGTDATFFSDHRWERFQRVTKVRDRLTHPKTKADLIVTDDDLVLMRDAVDWYWHAIRDAKNDPSFGKGTDDPSFIKKGEQL